MAAKKQIFVLRKQSHDQNFKNHFPNGIFQWNLDQSRRTWICMFTFFEIKFEKNILFKNGCQNKFCDIAQ